MLDVPRPGQITRLTSQVGRFTLLVCFLDANVSEDRDSWRKAWFKQTSSISDFIMRACSFENLVLKNTTKVK